MCEYVLWDDFKCRFYALMLSFSLQMCFLALLLLEGVRMGGELKVSKRIVNEVMIKPIFCTLVCCMRSHKNCVEEDSTATITHTKHLTRDDIFDQK